METKIVRLFKSFLYFKYSDSETFFVSPLIIIFQSYKLFQLTKKYSQFSSYVGVQCNQSHNIDTQSFNVVSIHHSGVFTIFFNVLI